MKLKVLIESEASGPLVYSQEPLSFWGGFDSHSGEVIDRRHELSGEILTGKLLAFPGSRGSSSGSGVLLEAIRNRTAPAAIITNEPDHILTLAALLAQELYGRSVAIAVAPPDFFEWASTHNGTKLILNKDGSVFYDEEF